ncbi:MAG: molybdenum cofactor guanylyltransferase MobA [Rhodovulum sulfidophilum]|uniref:Molybdenum cofactor guanylyltransferase n=1 Tax=Rhodovulum sulfidophilum TaxID=35806 RepID=A0A2W5QL27_RHOSU|nr:MAG: molybdenum cofactor guanylyltransferase MobA [Rhodovulum sulfidophilum]
MPVDIPSFATPAPIGGVILAGGRASRFGADKMLADLGGRPLVAHAIARLAPQVDALAISANGDPARFAAFGLPVLPDPVPGFQGPLAGVLAGLDWAAGLGLPAIVTVAGDTPVFPDDLVAALRAAAEAGGQPVALACGPGPDGAAPRPHPTFALWPVTLRGPLGAALARGERRVRGFAEAAGAARAVFAGRGAACFHNVNTPADLETAAAEVAP